MTERHPRRAFIARSARLVGGAATLSVFGSGVQAAVGPSVASAHNVTGNKARASELYSAMQANYYLGTARGSLYNETSPRARSNPYAYLWPFYEAMAGAVDLYAVGAASTAEVDDRLVGLSRYYRGQQAGYDSYPRSPYGGGGDRYNDDNAWIGRTLVQLHRMGDAFKLADGSTALQGAADVYQFLKTSWHTSPPYPAYPKPGGVFWIRSDFDRRPDRDRGAGATGGFAKLALHLHELTSSAYPSAYSDLAVKAYDWTRTYLYRTDNVYADKILPDGSIDWGVWSYNQGVMIGAGVLLARVARDGTYLQQAVTTADASLAYFNQYGWYNQPVIFNALFFRNLLLLGGALGRDDPKAKSYVAAAQTFADNVWNDPKIHNMQKHMIKFDPSTSAYKLREQAGMVQIYACLAWADAGKDLTLLC
jgi:hypothetical protein